MFNQLFYWLFYCRRSGCFYDFNVASSDARWNVYHHTCIYCGSMIAVDTLPGRVVDGGE